MRTIKVLFYSAAVIAFVFFCSYYLFNLGRKNIKKLLSLAPLVSKVTIR